jgi:hypothetical protein
VQTLPSLNPKPLAAASWPDLRPRLSYSGKRSGQKNLPDKNECCGEHVLAILCGKNPGKREDTHEPKSTFSGNERLSNKWRSANLAFSFARWTGSGQMEPICPTRKTRRANYSNALVLKICPERLPE